MKAVFASLIGLAALLVGGPDAATAAVILSPVLNLALWLLRPVDGLEASSVGFRP
jgi:hypothetical protein